MPVDPNIALQIGQNLPRYGPSPQTLLNMQVLAAKLQEIRNQVAGRNALRALYSNPANLGPGGMPTPQALSSLMGVAPEMGLRLQGSLAQLSERAARGQYLDAMMRDRGVKDVTDVGQRALGVYDAALASGMSPQQAQDKAQREVYGPGIAAVKSSGLVAPDVSRSISPQFDPVRARGELGVMNNFKLAQEQQKMALDRAHLGIAEKNLEYTGQRTAADVQRSSAAMMGPVTEVEVKKPGGGTDRISARIDKGVAGAGAQYFDLQGNAIDPKTVVREVPKTIQNQPTYAPETVDMLADQAMAGDPAALKSMWGGAQLRVQVLDALAKKAKARWGDQAGQNLAAINAMFAGQKTALGGLAKLRANVENFEGTALREANLALELAPKGLAGGIPVFNKWVQAGRKSVTGSPDVTRLDTAVTSLVNEYARIMSSPGATGGTTSDHARAEAAGLLNSAMTQDQFRAAIDTMKRSMANRVSAINQQMSGTIRDIQGGGGVDQPLSSPPANPASAPVVGASSPAAASASSAAPTSGVHQGVSEQQYNALPAGSLYSMPGDPRVFVKH